MLTPDLIGGMVDVVKTLGQCVSGLNERLAKTSARELAHPFESGFARCWWCVSVHITSSTRMFTSSRS